MWQTVERKARFIAQVMRGRLDVREIEDIGDAALSYSEVKALATGNPLLMDKAEADAELTRLERAERAHHRNHDALQPQGRREAGQRIAALTALTGHIDTAIARRTRHPRRRVHHDHRRLSAYTKRNRRRPAASSSSSPQLERSPHQKQPPAARRTARPTRRLPGTVVTWNASWAPSTSPSPSTARPAPRCGWTPPRSRPPTPAS